MTKRGWILCTVLAGVAIAAHAGAEAPSVPARCIALHALGQHPPDTLTRWAMECSTPSAEAPRVHAEVLRAIEYLDDAALAVVLDAFGDRFESLPLGWPANWQEQRGCREFAENLATELADQAPLMPEPGACQSAEDRVTVAFVSSPGVADSVELSVSGPNPGRALLTQPSRLARKEVFLAWLPRGVSYVARFREGEEVTGVVRGRAAAGIQVLQSVPVQICHELNFALSDPDSIVLVDGRWVQPARQWKAGKADRRLYRLYLNPGPHELVALGHDGEARDVLDGRRVVERLRTRFEAPADSAQCRTMAYDLRELERVALVSVDFDERCLDAGVSQRQVVTAANDFLREELGSERFVDSHAVRALFSGVAGFSETFTSDVEARPPKATGESPSPASPREDRGSPSPSKPQAEVAREYLRRGIQTALMLTAQCTRYAGEPEWTYTFTAQSLSLASKGGHVDPLTGRAPPEVRSQSETVRHSSLLFHAATAPLARLLGRPYVRFSSPNRDQRVHAWSRFSIVDFRPPDAVRAEDPVIRRSLLSDTDAGQLCPRLSDHAQLRGPMPPALEGERKWENLRIDDEPRKGDESHFDQGHVPRASGYYLTEVTSRPDGKPPRDARCVYVAPSGARIALTAGYALLVPGPREDHSSATLEYTVPLLDEPSYELRGGFFVGAAHSSFFRSTPPGWAPNLEATESGRVELAWTKDELLFGVHSDVRGNVGRFVGFAALQFPTLSVGKPRLTARPAGQDNFSNPNQTSVDFDLSVMVRAGLGAVVNQAVDVSFGVQGGVIAGDDWLTSLLSEQSGTAARRSILYDPSPTFGLFAEVGYFR